MSLISSLTVANWWPCSDKNVFQDGGCAQNLRRIVLALDGEADFLFLEAIEHVGLRDRVEALVVDLADGGLFFDEDVEDDALLRVFPLDAQILKVAGVPERVEVALDGDGIVGVTGMGEQAREYGLLGDAAVADDADRLNCGGRLGERAAGDNDQQEEDGRLAKAAGSPPRERCQSMLDLHRAGALRRTQVLVRSKVRLHGKNKHTLTARKDRFLRRGKIDYIGPQPAFPNLRPAAIALEPTPPVDLSSAQSAIGPRSSQQFTGTGSVWAGESLVHPELHPV